MARITDVKQSARGYANYQDWIGNTQLEQRVSLEDYSVSNRGLKSGLVGTPEQVAERILEFQLQFSPQLEEMERFAEEVIPLVNVTRGSERAAAGFHFGPRHDARKMGAEDHPPRPSFVSFAVDHAQPDTWPARMTPQITTGMARIAHVGGTTRLATTSQAT